MTIFGAADYRAEAQTAHNAGFASTLLTGLRNPFALAVDATETYAYIADKGNHRVIRVTIANDSVTNVNLYNSGTNPVCQSPVGVTVDSSGSVYFTCSGSYILYKATYSSGSYTVGTYFTFTSPYNPEGLAIDGSGNIYVAAVDTNSGNGGGVAKCTAANTCSWIANNNLLFPSPAQPQAVAVDSSGNIYVSDPGSNQKVWKYNVGTSTLSTFQSGISCYGISLDSSGNIYLGTNSNYVLKETLSNGSYTPGDIYTVPGLLTRSVGLAVNSGGSTLYLADYTDDGQSLPGGVTGPTPASSSLLRFGAAGQSLGTVAVGSTSAPLPVTFTFDSAGTLGGISVTGQGLAGTEFVNTGTGTCNTTAPASAGSSCTVIVTMTPARPGNRYGAVTLKNSSGAAIATAYLYGTGTGPMVNFSPFTATTVDSSISGVEGLAGDASGNLYAAASLSGNHIYKETLSNGSYTRSLVTTGALNSAQWVTVDPAGNLFIPSGGASTILKETPSGTGYSESTVASFNGGNEIAVDAGGNLYTASGNVSGVYKFTLQSNGSYVQSQIASNGNNPWGVTVDGAGNVFYVGADNGYLYKLTPAGSGYVQTTLDTSLSGPTGVAVDSSGNLYVANNAASGPISKYSYNANAANCSVSVANCYTKSSLTTGVKNPVGVWVDANDNVFVGDTGNNRILKLDFADAPSLTFATTSEGSSTTTATSGTNPVTLENVGNAQLVFPVPSTGTNPSVPANFSWNTTSGPYCPSLTSTATQAGTLQAGSSCQYDIVFAPQTGGSLSGSLVPTDNNLNAASPGYATQSIGVSGTGTYLTPAVSAVSPDYGPSSGGTSVTIAGTNLAGATAVNFGTAAGTIVSDSLTAITAVSPQSSAGSVDVTVTTPGGTSATSSADRFSFFATPTVTLALTSGGSATASVTSGAVVKLTATVAAGGSAVYPGAVAFCNAAASRCSDVDLAGTAELNSSGIASISIVPSIGSHSYKAVFFQNASALSASSANSPLTVVAASPASTATAIAQSGSVGNYSLTATVSSNSPLGAGPAGSVSFLDTSNGNAAVASATLGTAVSQTGFGTATASSTGSGPQREALFDYNNDGYLDLAVANTGGNSVTVYAGNSAAAYSNSPAATIATSDPTALAFGDFNGDGNQDLAVASYSNGDVVLYTGDGSGGFTLKQTVTLPGGSQPLWISVGDFNNDGVLDFVTTSQVSNAAHIYLGHGDGTFSLNTTLSFSSQPSSAALGDFNGDGDLDIAVPLLLNGIAEIYLGHGDGTFTAKSSPAVGTNPHGSVVADFNGDGIPDLAVASNGSSLVSVLLGAGDGTFSTAATFAVTGNPDLLAVGDFNGDGIADMVVGNSPTTILTGTGNGSFTTTTLADSLGQSLTGDLNGDGLSDIVGLSGNTALTILATRSWTATATATGVAIAGSGTHAVEASYPGGGNYAPSVSATTGLTAQTLSTSLTLGVSPSSPAGYGTAVTLTATLSPYATQNETTNGQTVTFYNGSTALGSATLSGGTASLTLNALPAGVLALQAAYAGSAYFAASSSSSMPFTIAQGTSATTLAVTSGGSAASAVAAGSVVKLTATVTAGTAPVTLGTVNFCNAAATYCTDVNLVGTAQLGSGGTASISLVPGIGSHSYKAVFVADSLAAGSSSTSAALTVTGLHPSSAGLAASGSAGNYTLTATVSGLGDLAAAPTGTVSFLDASNGNAVLGTGTLGAGTLTIQYTSPQTVTLPEYPAAVAAGDFNGDGKLDLAFCSQVTNAATIALGNGDGTFSVQSATYAAHGGSGIVAGDFNNDGKLDLAVTDYQGGKVSILMGNGDGTFTVGQTPSVGSTPQGIAAGDFNGDGRLDLVAANAGNSTATILLGVGDGTFTVSSTYPVGSFPYAASVGDFNGDGKLDIVVANLHQSTLTILLGNGDGSFTAGANVNVGNLPTWAAVGDINGDGKLDLAVSNYGDSTLTAYLGNGDGTFGAATATLSLPAGAQSVVLADLNGDGVLDMATAYTGQTQSFPPHYFTEARIYTGDGSGGFTLVSTQTTGSSTIALVAGDWNGDGFTDLATANDTYSGSSNILLTEPTQTATAALSHVGVVGTGTHNVKASYAGDGNYAASVSATTGLTAQTAVTALSLGVSPASPATYGTPLTLTATLSPSTAQGHSTDGETIVFSNGSTVLGMGTLSGGVATLPVSNLPVGTASLTATYAGDSNFASSSTSAVSYSVTSLGTTTALAVTAASGPVSTVSAGTAITLTATVVDANGTPVAAGTVAFCEAAASFCTGASLLGSVQLKSNGTAAVRFVPRMGSHSYKAVFAGVTGKSGSASSSAALSVTGAGVTTPYVTTTSIAASGSAGNYALTATVSGTVASFTAPTGSVAFKDASASNTVLTTAAISGAASSSFATVNSASLTDNAAPPRFEATADFNNDGKPDVAVASDSSSSFAVYTGNGDGTFASSYSGAFANPSSGLLAADFNNDGNLDIASISCSSNTVSVALGNGSGGFAPPAAAAAGSCPSAFAAGDFNGDGNLDIAVADNLANAVTVLAGDGSGGFQAVPSTVPAGGGPSGVAVGDFNGDGRLDLAVTNSSGGTVTIATGNGDGTFSVAATLSAGLNPKSIVVTDFNGDGKLDLAVANSGDSYLSVYLGDGNGGFTAQPHVPCNQPQGVAVADLDGDGKLDLVATDRAGSQLCEALGNGDGTFNSLGGSPSSGPAGISLADLNGDGRPDIVAVTLGGNSVTATLLTGLVDTVTAGVTGISPLGTGTHNVFASYSGDNSFGASASATTPLIAQPAATALTLAASPGNSLYGQPVTLTATLSPFAANGMSSNGETVTFSAGSASLGTGALAFGSATLTVASLPGGTDSLTAVYAGDADLAAATSSALAYTVAPATGQAAPAVALAIDSGNSPVSSVALGTPVTLRASVSAGGNPLGAGTVNFCNAAAADCVGLHRLGTAQLTGSGSAALTLYPAYGADSYRAVFAGIPGSAAGASSGAVPLTVTAPSISSTSTSIQQSGSAGNYTLIATVESDTNILAAPAGTVAFLDTSNGNYVLGTAALGSGAGSSYFTARTSIPFNPGFAVTADFNNDGKPDVAGASCGASTITVGLGNGDGTFSAASNPGGFSSPCYLAVGDMNGDGKPDLLVSDAAQNTVTVLAGNGDGTFTAAGTATLSGSGASPGFLSIGDFNGDGNLDVAVAQPQSTHLQILLGDGAGHLSAGAAVSLANGGGATAVADFNGDGKLDIAVTEPGTGGLQILLGNGDGTFAGSGQSLFAGNNPTGIVAGDFNGDGVVDLAVSCGDAIVNRFTGDGSGHFTASPIPAAAATGIATGDFNHDGYADLAIESSGVQVLYGNGNGSFQTPVLVYGDGNSTLVAADVNGDGVTDIVSQDNNFGYAYSLLSVLTENVSATVTGLSPIGSGSHAVEASYAGDGNFSGSVSATVSLTAQPSATTLALGANPASGTYGQPVTLTATLSPIAAQGHSADGEAISFHNGSALLGSANMSSGTASLQVAALPAGSDGISAVYAGDANFAPANATIQNFTVAQASKTIAFPALATPVLVNSGATLAATASNGDPVTYSVTSGNAAISGSTVTFTSAGSVTIAADSASTPNYAAAATVSQTVTVDPAPSLATAPTTPVGATSATQTATVNIVAPGTLASISVLTQGAPGLDFNAVTGGTCSVGQTYTAGEACTVEYSFSPRYPWLRQGGIELASTGAAMGSVYLTGTGVGPQVTFGSGTAALTQVSSGLNQPQLGLAVDGAGNLFVADAGNRRVVEIPFSSGSYGAPVTLASGISPQGVAVDGVGAVYFADDTNNGIAKIPLTGGSYGAASLVVSGFTPVGLALDSSGNVYYTDAGNGALKEVPHNAGGYGSPIPLVSNLASTLGIAVDASGDVFYADYAHGAIDELPSQGNGFGSPATVATGLSGPIAVAVDGAGNLYVAEVSSNSVVELPNDGGSFGPPVVLASGLNAPQAVAVDAAGNVYLGDTGNSALKKLALADPPALAFPSTNDGSTSAAQTVTVTNSGNAVLSADSVAASSAFTILSSGSTPAACLLVGSVAAGASCGLDVAFAPTSPQNGSVSGTAALTDNSLNTPGAVQTLHLTGTAVGLPSVTGVSPAYGPAAGGTAVVITGSQLSGVTAVYFGPSAATHVTVLSDTEITAIAPIGSGVTDVTVATAVGTSSISAADQFAYQAPQTIVFVPASPVTFGVSPIPLSASGGGSGNPVTFTLLSGPGTLSGDTLTVNGAGTIVLRADQAGNGGYTAAPSVMASIVVAKATPGITWAAPAAITYGTALGSAQLNATASVPGTFSYAPGVGSIPTAGTDTLSVTFSPADSADYNPATAAVQLAVGKATPVLAWATPAPITYGTPLGSAQLDATASVPGTFSYSQSAGSIPAAGTDTLSVTFTPADSADYTSATATVQLAVGKATPTITWVAPAAITYGTALGSAQLDATASVPGTFSYAPGVGSIPTAGTDTLSVTFSPADSADYTSATATVQLVVGKATPGITWAAPAAITYGTALGSAQLNATASVPGTFSYSPSAGSNPAAGTDTLSVTFTPTDSADYTSATATVQLAVGKATPVITWAAPAAITYGTALGSAQLDATASVPGTFSYSPASGSVPAAGTDTLSVTFTPTDTSDYTSANAAVQLAVGKASPMVTLSAPASSSFVENPVTLTAVVSAAAGVPSGTVTFLDSNVVLGTLPLSAGTASLTTSSLTAGTHTLTVLYGGDALFNPQGSVALTEQIQDFGLNLAPANGAAQPILYGGSAAYRFALSPLNGATLAGPVALTVTGLPVGATAAFSPSLLPAGSAQTEITLTVTLPAQAGGLRRPGLPHRMTALGFALLLLPFAVGRSGARRLKRLLSVAVLLAGLASIHLLSGCGETAHLIQAQSYPLTVTATSGALSHSTTVTLIVE